MQAIADELGVTRTAVQQIEKRAFEKLKKALKKRGITDMKD
jgi:DNA-directed RNA polymerase sigma subunit (sigma70/sigma32)